MNGDGTWVGLREMPITDVQEIFNNVLWRVGTVHEKQLVVLYTLSYKLTAVILCLIQSDNSLDVPLLEYVTVLVGSVSRSLARLPTINWSHESCEFSWDDPINITVLDSLIVLILLDIEGLEVVPLLLNSML